MPEADTLVRHDLSAAALIAGWREGLAIVNLRGDPSDAAFRERASRALSIALPVDPCSTAGGDALRVVWAGRDDWFVIGAPGRAETIGRALSEALTGSHHAVTDVSSGYTVLRLSGVPVLDVLSHGCPLDLHLRAFRTGMSAGSHFFKASVWLWKAGDAPEFEMLVRRSFRDYVWLLLERCSAECGLLTRRFT